jgi:hypothetical protein
MSKRIELKLHCDLDESELRDRGQQLAESLREAARVEKEKSDAAKDFKEQLEEIYGRMGAVAEAIREKCEFRLVACEVQFHTPVVGSKRTIRLDTGELLRDESMTMDEQQLNLYASPDSSEVIPKT